MAEQLPESQAAVHATAALGAPMATDGKVLRADEDGDETVEVVKAAPEQARELLSAALGDFDRAADSLGHIEVTEQTQALARRPGRRGRHLGAGGSADTSADALARRGVLPGVVEALRNE